MSEIEEFNRELIADVMGDADAAGLITAEAFFERMADLLTEAGELEGADRCYFEGRRKQKPLQIDGFGGDPREAEGVLSLIICDFDIGDTPRGFRAKELNARLERLSNFLKASHELEFREALEETSPAFGLADLISTTWNSVVKIKLILVTNAEKRMNVDGFPAGTIQGKPVTYNVWDLKRIRDFVVSGRAREDLKVDFANDFGGAVPVLRASCSETALESYVAVVPGTQLAAVYDRWGARLLEANVRSFLQARGKVNRGIRDTIRDEPQMFFSYNNGVTATAEAVEVVDGPSGPMLLYAENLQIVNGGQTTASIHAARKLAPESLASVMVQMKLSIVPPGMSEEVVPKISEFANSQNKVNAADFFSNHPFHVRIEEFSRRILAPASHEGYLNTKWFYERARGQYHDARGRKTLTERKKFDIEYPRKQYISKTDLAKFENSWRGRPEIVSLGAQKNFAQFAKDIGKQWAKFDTMFDETWYKRMIAKAIIFKALEKLVPKQPWYAGDYRAQVVTYTMAKLAHDTDDMDKVVDLDAVWRAQALADPLESCLLKAAEQAHAVITSPPDGIRNMSEWAKKQACWATLQKADVDYGLAIMKCVIEREDADRVVREGRAAGRLDAGIADEARVLELGADFWREALEWGKARRLLGPREAGIIETCANMPSRIPSERQSAIAMKALRRLEDEGFQALQPAVE